MHNPPVGSHEEAFSYEREPLCVPLQGHIAHQEAHPAKTLQLDTGVPHIGKCTPVGPYRRPMPRVLQGHLAHKKPPPLSRTTIGL